MKNLVTKLENSMFFIGGILCLGIAWMTGTGDILNYINFADPLNEMGFFMASIMLGGCLIACGFSK